MFVLILLVTNNYKGHKGNQKLTAKVYFIEKNTFFIEINI